MPQLLHQATSDCIRWANKSSDERTKNAIISTTMTTMTTTTNTTATITATTMTTTTTTTTTTDITANYTTTITADGLGHDDAMLVRNTRRKIGKASSVNYALLGRQSVNARNWQLALLSHPILLLEMASVFVLCSSCVFFRLCARFFFFGYDPRGALRLCHRISFVKRASERGINLAPFQPLCNLLS